MISSFENDVTNAAGRIKSGFYDRRTVDAGRSMPPPTSPMPEKTESESGAPKKSPWVNEFAGRIV